MSIKLAYIAGFFDGEGTIYIAVNKPYPKFQTISPNHWLCAAIGNTDSEIIDQLKADFGGHISRGGGGHVKRQQPYFIWAVVSNQAKVFLQRIYPFLRGKRQQAKLAIAFQNERSIRHGGKGVPDEVLARRDWYRTQISRLNNLNSSSSGKL